MGTQEVPHKIWATFIGYKLTNRQTNRQAKYINKSIYQYQYIERASEKEKPKNFHKTSKRCPSILEGLGSRIMKKRGGGV